MGFCMARITDAADTKNDGRNRSSLGGGGVAVTGAAPVLSSGEVIKVTGQPIFMITGCSGYYNLTPHLDRKHAAGPLPLFFLQPQFPFGIVRCPPRFGDAPHAASRKLRQSLHLQRALRDGEALPELGRYRLGHLGEPLGHSVDAVRAA